MKLKNQEDISIYNMKIDKVIQFEDNYQKAVIDIHYTYSWLNNLFCGDFQKFKLTDIQISSQGLKIISHLPNEPKITDFIRGNLSGEEAETLNNLLDKVRGGDLPIYY